MTDFPNATASDGSLLIAANNVSSTLNGGISAIATAMTLASSVHFPSKGGVTIESEAIIYNANNTATGVLTILTRGADSTTAAVHADGTPVYGHMQARHHNALKDEIISIEQNIFNRFGTGTSTLSAIKGDVSGNNKSSGYVGEYVEQRRTSDTNFPTSTQFGDGTSTPLSLTAGEWYVSAMLAATINGATWSAVTMGIGTETGNTTTGLATGHNFGGLLFSNTSTHPTDLQVIVPEYRLNTNANTTLYMKVSSIYTAGNPQYRGRISAKRA